MPVQTRVQNLAADFDKNDTIKNYKEAALRAANVKSILKSKWSGPGDMAIVFEFMRSLDPTSVVREAEYETARKTGNWFKGAFAKFNGLFNESGGFLSDQVKKDFNAVLDNKIRLATKQVKGMYNDFGRRIENITRKQDGLAGTDHLTDYTAFFDDEDKPAPTTTATPKPAATATDKAPAGVDQADWNVMTKEEKALWLK